MRPTGDVAGAVPTPALPEAPSSEVPEVELVTEEAGVEMAPERLSTCTLPEAARACLRAIAVALFYAIL